MNDTALNARQVRKNQKREKERQKVSLANWQAVLSTESGRYVLLELLDWCAVFRALPVEPHLLSTSAGVQRAGHHILQKIAEADPVQLAPLLAAPYLRDAKERLERELEDEARRRKPEDQDITED